jgi:hypothetical protein
MWLTPLESPPALNQKFTMPAALAADPEAAAVLSRRLILAAIHHRDRRVLLGDACGLAACLDHEPQFLGAHEGPADIAIFRSHVERNQAVAMRAVGLETVTHSAGALAKNLRALCALDLDFLVDHERSFGGDIAASSLGGKT